MGPTLSVFHGLSMKFLFERFTAYFNHPISTTSSYIIAHQFSKGIGVILRLMAAANVLGDIKRIPKYMSVSWMSSFPGEEELLFYGRNVIFALADIAEAENHTKHSKELAIFNLFQNIVLNEKVQWTGDGKAQRTMRKKGNKLAALIQGYIATKS